MSQRPEFLNEIYPKIEQTSDGIKLHFNMFFEGEPITVTIDDLLPFNKNNRLVYARSLRSKKIFSKSSDLLRNDEDLETSSNSGYRKFSKHSLSLCYDLNKLSLEDTKNEKTLGINNLFLAAFFEKVFVKQTYNYSYKRSIGTHPLFAFSTFSNCLTCYYT